MPADVEAIEWSVHLRWHPGGLLAESHVLCASLAQGEQLLMELKFATDLIDTPMGMANVTSSVTAPSATRSAIHLSQSAWSGRDVAV